MPDRRVMTGQVSALKKKVIDAGKGSAKANVEAAKAEAEELAAASDGKPYVVGLLKAEADAKVVEAACNIVSAKLPEAAVLILGAGKTACALGVVPKGLAEKVCAAPEMRPMLCRCARTADPHSVLISSHPYPCAHQVDAKEWVNAALQPCGGKGGGKPNRAQGAARDASNIAQAHTAAIEFAKSKMD